GFSGEVISGEDEARRTMVGVRSGLPRGTSDVLAVDIGGGHRVYCGSPRIPSRGPVF
ncbi:MAG: hypothetical protein H0W13_09135, partial [Nitrospirales bacterium]|nr:hypothetical protein [Nitrospirales bacterium]